MFVGVGRIVLDFYGNDNVAKKHREMDGLVADLRKKFNVSALEVAEFDDPERCVLGFCTSIPETWKEPRARGLMEQICAHIDQTAFTRVTVEDWDLLSFGTEFDGIDGPEDEGPTPREIILRKLNRRRG